MDAPEMNAIDSIKASLVQESATNLSTSNDKEGAATLEEEISFVGSFMIALTRGTYKGKEDGDLLRKRKERKKEINRASAKRKRARAKQELDSLANQCQQLERETKQLKDDNARLIVVIRDELEKRSLYMAQIEYLNTSLQQQRQLEERAISHPDTGDDVVTTSDAVSTEREPAMPLGAAGPTTSTVPPAPASNSVVQGQPPSNGSQGAHVLQLLSDPGPALAGHSHVDQARSDASTLDRQAQQEDPSSQQQQLQVLIDALGSAVSSASQSVSSHAAPAAPAPGSIPVLNQETLNQLQMLLTTLISAASASFSGTVTPAPPSSPQLQVPISHEAAQQLQGILSALASATPEASTLEGHAGTDQEAFGPPPPEAQADH